jgi:hypothetical protein
MIALILLALTQRQTIWDYATDPIPVNVKQLPAGYLGTDSSRLFHQLATEDWDKKPNETDAQAEKRLANQNVYGSMTGSSRIAVEVSTVSWVSATAHAFPVLVENGEFSFDNPKNHKIPRLLELKTLRKVKFEENDADDDERIALLVHNAADWGFERYEKKPNWSIEYSENELSSRDMLSTILGMERIPPEEIAIFTLVPPFASQNEGDCEDSRFYKDLIVVNLKELILFDPATGRILGRKTPPKR